MLGLFPSVGWSIPECAVLSSALRVTAIPVGVHACSDRKKRSKGAVQMGIFDDDQDIDAGGGGLRADPDALVDLLDSAAESAQRAYESVSATAQQVASDAGDAAGQYAADIAQRAEDDPLGLANDAISTANSVINPMA